MPKIRIIRKGARRPVSLPAQTAHALAATKGWNYAEEVPTISRPKRAVKRKHEASSDDAAASRKPEAVEEAKAQAAKPMTSKHVAVAPTQKAKPVASRDELEEMTKADLKQMGLKMGVNLLSSDSKSEFVDKIYRYMRRDMRAAR